METSTDSQINQVITTLIDHLERVNPGPTKYMRTIVGSRSNTSIIVSTQTHYNHTTTTTLTTTEVDSRLITEGIKPVIEFITRQSLTEN